MSSGAGKLSFPSAGEDGLPDQWHPEGVPRVSTPEELDRAAADFAVTDLGLVIEPPALAAARRSLEESGFLLLGEVHGVRENPLVIRSLMQAFGLSGLALEWPEDLAPIAGAFLAGGRLADHPLLWSGDGRITAGHLAVLRERPAAGPLSLTLFDGTMGADWNWSQHDEAMARRILAAPATGTGTLVVAGNAHTPTARTGLGVPLGACLTGQRPGLREIRISYGGGRFYAGSAAVSVCGGAGRGCTSDVAASSWTCPQPGKRSCRSGPCHGRRGRTPDSDHPATGPPVGLARDDRHHREAGQPGTMAPQMTSSRPDDIRDAN